MGTLLSDAFVLTLYTTVSCGAESPDVALSLIPTISGNAMTGSYLEASCTGFGASGAFSVVRK